VSSSDGVATGGNISVRLIKSVLLQLENPHPLSALT